MRGHGTDLGIAHDGVPTALAVDADSSLVDGDQLMAIIALSLRDQSRHGQGTVVATVMANLGSGRRCSAQGDRGRGDRGGDRYVLEAMLGSGTSLGGEQSGHVV